MPPRTFILFNPGSGHQGDPDLGRRLCDWAEARADRVTIHHLQKSDDMGEICRRAIASGHDRIAAAGGDGTIAGVAEALAGQNVPMAVIPMGTFNYFARGLGVPLDLDEALKLLDSGTPQPVAIGKVNDSIFLNNASLGVYPAILENRESIYRRWGRSRLAAYVSVVMTIAGFRRGRRMRIVVDGEERRRRSPLLFVANSAYQLENFGLPGADAIRDGKFAVFVGADVGRWGLLRHAALLMGRSMKDHRHFELLTGREVEVSANARPLVAIDGERRRMIGTVHVTRHQGALRVVLPAEAATQAA